MRLPRGHLWEREPVGTGSERQHRPTSTPLLEDTRASQERRQDAEHRGEPSSFLPPPHKVWPRWAMPVQLEGNGVQSTRSAQEPRVQVLGEQRCPTAREGFQGSPDDLGVPRRQWLHRVGG